MARAGLNASGLARALQTTPSTVSGWLNNGAIPRRYQLARLAGALAASERWLAGEDVNENAVRPETRDVNEGMSAVLREDYVPSTPSKPSWVELVTRLLEHAGPRLSEKDLLEILRDINELQGAYPDEVPKLRAIAARALDKLIQSKP